MIKKSAPPEYGKWRIQKSDAIFLLSAKKWNSDSLPGFRGSGAFIVSLLKPLGSNFVRNTVVFGKYFLFLVLIFSITLTFLSRSFAQDRTTRKRGETREPAASEHLQIQDTVRNIPWEDLSKESKSKIKSVLGRLSFFRRLPQQAVYCDTELYRFLMEHPDMVVAFWEQLGVTQISLKELEKDRFALKETGGTVAVADILYQSDDLSIVYSKGEYRGPFLAKAIEGESVLVLRTRYCKDKANEPFVICRLDAFVHIENLGADLIAKLFSNYLGKIADNNFEQTVGFIGNLSEASSTNTQTVRNTIDGMHRIRPEVRHEFEKIVDRIASHAENRTHRRFPQYEIAEEENVLPISAPEKAPVSAKTVSNSKKVVPDEELPSSNQNISSLDSTASETAVLRSPGPTAELSFEIPMQESSAAEPMEPNDDIFATTPENLPLPSRRSTLNVGSPVPPPTGAVFGTPKIAKNRAEE